MCGSLLFDGAILSRVVIQVVVQVHDTDISLLRTLDMHISSLAPSIFSA